MTNVPTHSRRRYGPLRRHDPLELPMIEVLLEELVELRQDIEEKRRKGGPTK